MSDKPFPPPAKLYRIAQWDKFYENNRSRKIDDLRWVALPNRHDGENYTGIITHPKGAVIYAAWILMVQIASKCKPRGTLIRDNQQPHTPLSLSLKTRAPIEWFQISLDYLERYTDWLVYQEVMGECRPPDVRVTPDCPPGDEEGNRIEENGIEEKERKEAPVGAQPVLNEFPSHLNTGRIQNKWQVWMNVRRGMRNKPKNWLILFNEQIEMLSGYTEPEAFEILSASIRGNWQGLFPPKTYGNKNNRSVNSKRIEPDYTKGF